MRLVRMLAGTLATVAVAGGLATIVAMAPDASAAGAVGVANAYTFLDHQMDRYATGTTTRLVQSYVPDAALGNFTDSVTYDDALVVDALLARGTADDLARARVIGNALLYVQAHDSAADGRVRAAYAPKPLTSPSQVHATDATSDVGNMAWVGQALVQLYARTGDRTYLTGATRIATWIRSKAYDTRGAGGYTGGYDGSSKILWKSTEHNLDVYAFFTMLATESGDPAWNTDALHAKAFAYAMWDPAGKRYWVGTDGSGVTLNKDFLPEDVNTWMYLAFKDPTYRAAIDWDVTNLAVTDGTFSGVSFGACDRSKVWFEGTAHLADALETRGAQGDPAAAQRYLSSLTLAQTTAPNHDGNGIVAASRDKLSDCDGDFYYASPHTGATSWYLLAAAAVDPFLLIGNALPGNDFSLSLTPAAGSVAPGGSAVSTVDTAVTSGSAQPVTLSVSGLPAGATASPNPATVTAGGSSTLTIATAPTTPAGTYPVTVTGTGASATRRATFTLTVGAASVSYQAEAAANTLTGTANVIACTACSGAARVGHLGRQSTGAGTLTVNGVNASGGPGTYRIVVGYTNGSAARTARISVNGGPALTVTFAATGSFAAPGQQTVALTLAAGANTITFTNDTAKAPDIDGITVPGTPS